MISVKNDAPATTEKDIQAKHRLSEEVGDMTRKTFVRNQKKKQKRINGHVRVCDNNTRCMKLYTNIARFYQQFLIKVFAIEKCFCGNSVLYL